MELFTDAAGRRRHGHDDLDGVSSSWTLTALPLFIWMGEILFRTRLSEDMFKGLAPWMTRLPGRPAAHQHRRLHDLRGGLRLLGRDRRHGRQDVDPGAARARGYPERMTIGTLAGAGTLGLMIPPSIIMIVYGVTVNESIAQLFIAGVVPGLMLAALFMGYIVVWALLNPERVPAAEPAMTFSEKLRSSRAC